MSPPSGKLPKNTSSQISHFVFPFKESSKRFVLEILTQNPAFNLSGALFLVGLGCSLKWWYKDQLVIALLKQNLPALSEPQQRTSWETGEYVTREQNRQFIEKKSILSNFENIWSSEYPNDQLLADPVNKLTPLRGKKTNELVIGSSKEGQGVNKSFGHLIERVDLYGNHVVLKFKSPWEKHAYQRFVGVFSEPTQITKCKINSKDIKKCIDVTSDSLENYNEISSSQPLGGSKRETHGTYNKRGVKRNVGETPNIKTKYTLWKPLVSNTWFKLSARGLCVLNKEFPSYTTFGFLPQRGCVEDLPLRGKKVAGIEDLPLRGKKEAGSKIHKTSLSLPFLETIFRGDRGKIWNCFGEPIERSLTLPVSLANLTNKKNLESSQFRQNWTITLKNLLSLTSFGGPKKLENTKAKQKSANHLEIEGIKDCNEVDCNVVDSRPSYPKEEQDNEILFEEEKVTTYSAAFASSMHPPAGVSAFEKEKRHGDVEGIVSGQNTFGPVTQSLWGKSIIGKLSYPLELTTTMAGWQPPIDTLILNSYLDEIPYKLESTLLLPPCKKNTDFSVPSRLDLSGEVQRPVSFSNLMSLPVIRQSQTILFSDQESLSSPLKEEKSLAKSMGPEGYASKMQNEVGFKGNYDLTGYAPSRYEIPKQVQTQGVTTLMTNPTSGLAGTHPRVCTSSANKELSKKRTFKEEGKHVLTNSAHIVYGDQRKSALDMTAPSETFFKKLQFVEIKQLLKNELQFLVNTLPLTFVKQFVPVEYNNVQEPKVPQFATPSRGSNLINNGLLKDPHDSFSEAYNPSNGATPSSFSCLRIPKVSYSHKSKYSLGFLLTPQVESVIKGGLENYLFLLNNLDFTFNNLTSLSTPPFLLPITNDASFWMWKSPANITYSDKKRFQSGKLDHDTIFRLDKNSLTWEILQKPSYDQHFLFFSKAGLTSEGGKKKNLKTTINTKLVNCINRTVLKESKTTIAKVDSINPVDKRINFVNRKSRFMSGYVYPDVQSNLLKTNLYQWISVQQENMSIGDMVKTLFLVTPKALAKKTFLSFYATLMNNPTSGVSKQRGVSKKIAALSKNIEVTHDITQSEGYNKIYSLLYPKSFTRVNRFIDKASLVGVKIPTAPTTFLSGYFEIFDSQLLSTLHPTLTFRRTTEGDKPRGVKEGAPLLPKNKSSDCLITQNGQEIKDSRLKEKVDCVMLPPKGLPPLVVRPKEDTEAIASKIYPKGPRRGCIEDAKQSGVSNLVGLEVCAPEVQPLPPTRVSKPCEFYAPLSLGSHLVASIDREATEYFMTLPRFRLSSISPPTPFDPKGVWSTPLWIPSVSQLLTKSLAFNHHLAYFPGFTKPNQLFFKQLVKSDDGITSKNVSPSSYADPTSRVSHKKSCLSSEIEDFNDVFLPKSSASALTLLDIQGRKMAQNNKSFFDCSPRKTAYHGIVVQRNKLTKDFQPLKSLVKQSSTWGTAYLGPENPLSDRQCHFFGQRRLSTIDTNIFQRDYLRQLGKETLGKANSKGWSERPITSVERAKILSFSKAVNAFPLRKRKYTYLLEEKDQWHFLFQEQLRTALEDPKKYPPLTPEQAKEHGPGRIKVSAPLIMARFPVKSSHNECLPRSLRIEDTKPSVVAKVQLGKPFEFHANASNGVTTFGDTSSNKFKGIWSEGVPEIISHYPLFTERNRLELDYAPLLNKSALPFFNGVNNLQWLTQEPLTVTSWAIISQWFFLLALLFWIEQMLVANVFPALFALEQLLLGATGMKSGDRTDVIRISKGNTPKFKDIAGVDGLLGELAELVLFLRGHKGRLWNKKGSHGVLLTGPPGTGKTFLVRALANEARVPVLILSAGALTASKVNSNKPSWAIRHAFRRAKVLAPCILFIDEIDALGRSRGKIVTDINEIVADTNMASSNLHSGQTISTSILPYQVEGYEQLEKSWPSVSKPLINEWQFWLKSTPVGANEIDRFSLCGDEISDFYFTSKGGKPSLSEERNYGKASTNEKNSIESARTNDLPNKNQAGREKGDNATQRENIKRKFGPLTQLLVSMDGVSNLSGVLIMGATNRPESLDPALTRPGRFERVIRVEKPAEQKRIEILQLYSHNLGVQHEIPWSYLANRTVGLTAADLAVAMNYSSLKAIVQGTMHTIETIEYGLDSITRFLKKTGTKNVNGVGYLPVTPEKLNHGKVAKGFFFSADSTSKLTPRRAPEGVTEWGKKTNELVSEKVTSLSMKPITSTLTSKSETRDSSISPIAAPAAQARKGKVLTDLTLGGISNQVSENLDQTTSECYNVSDASKIQLNLKSYQVKRLQRLAQIAFYQAGKVVIQTLLPQHPPVALITLDLSGITTATSADTHIPVDGTFNTHWRSFLESRLIGLYGGKATSFLLESQHALIASSYATGYIPTSTFGLAAFASSISARQALRGKNGAKPSLASGQKFMAERAFTQKFNCDKTGFQSNIGNREVQNATQLATAMVNKWNFYSLQSEKLSTLNMCGSINSAASLPLSLHRRCKQLTQSTACFNESFNESTIFPTAVAYASKMQTEGGRKIIDFVNKLKRKPWKSQWTDFLGDPLLVKSKDFKGKKAFLKNKRDKFSWQNSLLVPSLESYLRYLNLSFSKEPRKLCVEDSATFASSMPATQALWGKKQSGVERALLNQNDYDGATPASNSKKQFVIAYDSKPLISLGKVSKSSLSNDQHDIGYVKNSPSDADQSPLSGTSNVQENGKEEIEECNLVDSRPSYPKEEQDKEVIFEENKVDFNNSKNFFQPLSSTEGVSTSLPSSSLNPPGFGRTTKGGNPLGGNVQPEVSLVTTSLSGDLYSLKESFVRHKNALKVDNSEQQMPKFSQIAFIAKNIFVGENLRFAISQSRGSLKVRKNKKSSYSDERTSVDDVGKIISSYAEGIKNDVFNLINPLQFSNVQRDRFYPGWFRLYLPDIEATEFMKNVANYYFSLGLQTLTRSSLSEFNLRQDLSTYILYPFRALRGSAGLDGASSTKSILFSAGTLRGQGIDFCDSLKYYLLTPSGFPPLVLTSPPPTSSRLTPSGYVLCLPQRACLAGIDDAKAAGPKVYPSGFHANASKGGKQVTSEAWEKRETTWGSNSCEIIDPLGGFKERYSKEQNLSKKQNYNQASAKEIDLVDEISRKKINQLDASFSLSLEKQRFPIGSSDLSVIEKEFIYPVLVSNCFAKAFILADQNRQLIDYFADYLIRFQILRQHQILYLFSAVLLSCKKQR